MEMFTTAAGIEFLARYGHVLAGIAWIGMLYYFNFVQTEYFKEAEGPARTDAFVKLVPRALWWFRWAAMLTFITGVVLLAAKGRGLTYDIGVGSLMAIFMFLNVWLIIWPNQRILIASNTRVQGGGEALPEAAAAAPKAALASRTNTLFSVPMLFFMISSAHFSVGGPLAYASVPSLIVVLLIVLALEANAVFGRVGPMATVRGVISAGFGLTVVLWALVRFL